MMIPFVFMWLFSSGVWGLRGKIGTSKTHTCSSTFLGEISCWVMNGPFWLKRFDPQSSFFHPHFFCLFVCFVLLFWSLQFFRALYFSRWVPLFHSEWHFRFTPFHFSWVLPLMTPQFSIGKIFIYKCNLLPHLVLHVAREIFWGSK